MEGVCAEMLDVRAERNVSIGMARGHRRRVMYWLFYKLIVKPAKAAKVWGWRHYSRFVATSKMSVHVAES